MKHPHVNCGYVDTGYPVDTAGNRHQWVCMCKTTACQKKCKQPTNYFEEMFTELTDKEEKAFYDKVLKNTLLT